MNKLKKWVQARWWSWQDWVEDHPGALMVVLAALTTVILLLAVVPRAESQGVATGYPIPVAQHEDYVVVGLPCPTNKESDIAWRIDRGPNQTKELSILMGLVATYPSNQEQFSLRVQAFQASMDELGFGKHAAGYLLQCWMSPV